MEDSYAAYYRTVPDCGPFIKYRISTDTKTVFCHTLGSISTRFGHCFRFYVPFWTLEIFLKSLRMDHTRNTAHDPAVDHL